MSRRVLITGLSTFWGSRLAQVLEKDPANEAIIGVSPRDPALPLERTEFVRVGSQHALLRRIVHAAEIDTVIDTRLVVDSKIVPELGASHASRSWNARGSSLCPGQSRQGVWYTAVVESSKPSMRRGRRTGHWTLSPLPHSSGV